MADSGKKAACGGRRLRGGFPLDGESAVSKDDQEAVRGASVVFDLDGTLLDSAPDLQDCANHALASVSEPPMKLEEVRGYIGDGISELVRRLIEARGLNPDSHSDLSSLFLERYAANPHARSRPHEGTDCALQRLSDLGVPLGICTNKPEGITRSILDHLGWSRHFAAVVGGDTTQWRKPDPRPLLRASDSLRAERCVFVGDSEADCHTAQAARIPIMLFEGGYRKTPLRELRFDASFPNYGAFRNRLAELLEREPGRKAGFRETRK